MKVDKKGQSSEAQHNPVPGTVKQHQLAVVLGKLSGLPDKSPIAFEVSRVVKAARSMYELFEESKNDLMSQYVEVDEGGDWVLTQEAKDSIEEAEKSGEQATPTVFAYRIVKGKEEEYKQKMESLLNTEVSVGVRSVDVNSKMVRGEEGVAPLVDCLSDYFGAGQINFLEEIGILEGLD